MKRIFTLLVCFATFVSQAQTPNYSEHVAPILYKHCTSCHHPGDIAPFSLMTYADAFAHKQTMAAATQNHTMPPWPADPYYVTHAAEKRLSQAEIQTLQDWATAGGQRGDSTKAPQAPTYNNASKLARTDVSLRIPTFTVDTSSDVYQCFVLHPNDSTGRFISGIEVLPGNRKVVHHVLVFYDSTGVPDSLDQADPLPGYRRFGGTGSAASSLLGLWAPGGAPIVFPSGMGMPFGRKSSIVLQVHYAPYNEGERDSTRINLMLSNSAGMREVYISPLLNHSFTLTNGPLFIPADSVRTFYSQLTLPFKISILSLAPHMHLIGKRIKAYAVNSGNDTIPLVSIPDWDFHWQYNYGFRKPQVIPFGAKLKGEALYDNTSGNPNNPSNPPKPVFRGEGTTEEMMLIYFFFLRYQTGDENLVLDSSWFVGNKEIKTPQHRLLLYPNPAQQQLTLATDDTQLQEVNLILYDLTGKKVAVFGQVLTNQPLQLGAMAAGLYIAEIEAGGTTERQKLVIRQ